MKEKIKICIVTGTRAEYSLLRKLIFDLNDDENFDTKLIVTGAHLSERYGHTINEIFADRIPIFKTIDLNLDSDTPYAISKATSKGMSEFACLYKYLNPDLLLVLGDRYELLSAVIPACFEKIPIAHIHGGELTEGLIDEAIRHSITKFSHLHFVAAEEYKKRVIQLGENPKNVFNVGGLGIDAINNTEKLSKFEIEEILDIKLLNKSLLITFHPVTLEKSERGDQINDLLEALNKLKDTTLIFTMPNADPGNNSIYEKIKSFTKQNHNSFLFKSLGRKIYFSLMRYVDAVVGNSSSGILEAPFFRKPTINIGIRQKGRLCAKSIINVNNNKNEIYNAINKIYNDEFLKSIPLKNSLFGEGGASLKILKILKNIDYDKILNKQFFDIRM